MTKDTRGLPKNEVVKKDMAAKAEAADAKIAAQAKDMTPEQIQAANATRLEGMPSSGGAVKNAAPIPDPLTPKPTIEEITPAQEKRASVENVGSARPGKTKGKRSKGRGNVTPLNFGQLPTRAPEPATSADTEENLAMRQRRGMGLPGSENGVLALAKKLHESDRQKAIATGKVVNDISPTDPEGSEGTVYTSHHFKLAKVMTTMNISDPEVYSRAASATGQRVQTFIKGLHKTVQNYEDSKRLVPQQASPNDSWQHPTTGKIHKVSENHPDMPESFEISKGEHHKVNRDPNTGEVLSSRGKSGWVPMKLAGGTKLFRQVSAPKGIDYVDHMRSEMLGEFGPSVVSRKNSAAKTSDIADELAASSESAVPRGFTVVGKEKVASTSPIPKMTSRPRAGRNPNNRRAVRPHGSSTQPADMIYTPNMVTTEVEKPILRRKRKYTNVTGAAPFPPKSSNRDTGMMLVGQAPLDQPLGPKAKPESPISRQFTRTAFQPTLPGTGVPKAVTSVVKPPVYGKMEGPLSESQAADLDLSLPLPKPPKGSASEQMLEQGAPPGYKPESYAAGLESDRKKRNQGLTEDAIRTRVIKPAETSTSYIPTDREWKRSEPARGQQFAINTEGMTGAQELRAIASQGGLASQKPSASRELVVRPGGKKQAKKDMRTAKATPKPSEPEQLSLFPDHEVIPGRSNQFYMAGRTQEVSPQSRLLQAASEQPIGRKPNNKDFVTENEQSVEDRLSTNIKGEANTSDALMKQWRASNTPRKRVRKPKNNT